MRWAAAAAVCYPPEVSVSATSNRCCRSAFHSSEQLLGDDIDEIVADERRVEILEYVSVDVSERAMRAVFVAVVERAQYPALGIWSWVGAARR